MNKTFFLGILLFVPFFMHAREDRVLLAGSIQLPAAVTKAPALKVFYQGYKYVVDISHAAQLGRFELYTDRVPRVLYLMITENLQIPDKNNFSHFKTAVDFPYRLFKLVQSFVPAAAKGEAPLLTWSVQEVFSREKEIVVPDNTVIFFMPPALIAGLEEDPWSDTQHIIRLPRIVFHEKITQEVLQEAATRMTLALLDFELFHAELPKRLMITDSRIVAMPYLHHSNQV
jgi:hypothetical protein